MTAGASCSRALRARANRAVPTFRLHQARSTANRARHAARPLWGLPRGSPTARRLAANTREQLTHAEESFVTDPGPDRSSLMPVSSLRRAARGEGSGGGAVEPQEAWLRDFHAGTRDCMERCYRD